APQSVSLTSPANNAALAVGSNVALIAAATSTGTVSKVEFFVNGSLIGQSTSSPYTLNWTPTAAGTVALTAAVSDNTSLVTTSSVVNVVCYDPGAGALQFNGSSSYVTFGQATTTL